MRNLMLPGNPRYQPKELQPVFGYDNLYDPAIAIEVATLRVLGEIGVIPEEDIALLEGERHQLLYSITTTQVDEVERSVTRHDVRALVRLMQESLPEPLRRWVHVPLTSYDVLDTARSIQFYEAHFSVVKPKVEEVMEALIDMVTAYSDTPQIGRTHGQHALPITVGFWLATILSRLVDNLREANEAAANLRGKISGAVGAYNAQVGLGIAERCGDTTFEERVLKKVGLGPAPISTQILPPEPLANYLFACLKLSATFAQLGRDCRHLMRSEIGELGEPFAAGQVGSSTMAHKRNPINFESLEGMYERNKAEMGKVLAILVSDHQRDLVGSSVLRDLPIIVVNLTVQLNTLLRKSGDVPFIKRVKVDTDACLRNLKMAGDLVLAEPMYIALQMAGYQGDAHELVSHHAIPEMMRMSRSECSLVAATRRVLREQMGSDEEAEALWAKIPDSTLQMLREPVAYTGAAAAKAVSIVEDASFYLAQTRSNNPYATIVARMLGLDKKK